LPGWQEFYTKHQESNFEILSVSVDLQGPEVVKPYVNGTTFPTVVDSENILANLFGFNIVPNGIFVDELGVIKMIKQGFNVGIEEHTQALEQLIRGEVESVVIDDNYFKPTQEVSVIEKKLAHTKFTLGMEYSNNGKKDKALEELDEAIQIDPDNFLIRKQRWYIRHPEKFSPEIDIEWQQQQYEQEKIEEARLKGEECGPEGCLLPGTQRKAQGQ
jgi:tetratricopeptide (TPR) repeat protein